MCFRVAGAVILRLFVLLTQGKVTIIEEQMVRLCESLWLAGPRVTDLGRMPIHLEICPCITGRKTGLRGYLG